jgi:predicted O-methyltransferase YrrM
MPHYKHSKTWFLNSEINLTLKNFLDTTQENHILEIGCFEGLSSVFFADNFLDHPNSTLTCVDPFLRLENNDHRYFLQNNEESNFDYNLSVCKNSEKVIVHKVTSDDFFKTAVTVDKKYNFIYVDGCHEPGFIKRDMDNSFRCLTNGGIMWMDDYCGGDGIQNKNAMHSFLDEYTGRHQVIHVGYQLAIKKY